MKNRITSIMVLTLVMLLAAVFFAHDDAAAVSRAHSETDLIDIMAATSCKGGTPCREDFVGNLSDTVECQSQNSESGSYAWSWATARPDNPYWVVVRDSISIAHGDAGWGKACVYTPFYRAEDSLFAYAMCALGSLDTIEIEFGIQGFMKIAPRECPNLKTWFTIMLWNKSTVDTIFEGQAILAGATGFTASGDLHNADFTQSILGDVMWQRINKTWNFKTTANCNDLALEIGAPQRAANVPTLTQWGIIVLVGFLISSAVFIMLKRKRSAVPA